MDSPLKVLYMMSDYSTLAALCCANRVYCVQARIKNPRAPAGFRLGGITLLGIHTYLSFSLLANDKKTSLPATGRGILVLGVVAERDT